MQEALQAMQTNLSVQNKFLTDITEVRALGLRLHGHCDCSSAP